jgi:predicted DNA-binding transcriptional regulator YafY
MRRADRLFDIIQALRSAKRPLTAATLAERLEVTRRTIYRDIATLQARRIPIEGEAGIGYVLRRGYDLPPLMLTAVEAEAVAVGVRLVRRVRDAALLAAAESVLSKLSSVVPAPLRQSLNEPHIWVSDGSTKPPTDVDLAEVRSAIRAARKLSISYLDEQGRASRRTVRPLAMVYYVDATLIAAWCELRGDYRHFRVDRVRSCVALAEDFAPDAARHRAEWLALRRED